MDLGDRVLLIVLSALLSSLLTIVIIWLSSLHKRQEKHGDSLSELKEKMPVEYVRREDWIISFGKIEQKIDAIWEFVHQHIESTRKGGG